MIANDYYALAILLIVLAYTMLGTIVALIAHYKGFDWIPWFLYGVIVWPVALTHALVRPSALFVKNSAVPELSVSALTTSTTLQDKREACPECAEMILSAAKKCRYCGTPVTKPAEVHKESILIGLDQAGIEAAAAKGAPARFAHETAADYQQRLTRLGFMKTPAS